jgi:rhomboid protease GluP
VNNQSPEDFSYPEQDDTESTVAWAATPQADSKPAAKTSSRKPRPYITYTLLGLTIAVYLLQMLTTSLFGFDVPVQLGVKVNELIAQGQVWRLITPILLHGSIVHIGFNMYALYLFGPNLESSFGHWRFLALYLIGGFAGNVFSMMFTEAASLGSSTAIFGLLGAQGVFIHHNRKIFGEQVSQASLRRIIQVAAINLVIGLSPGIDNWGHIGGLIGGTIFTWLGGPLIEVRGLHPNYMLVDRREKSEIVQAAAIATGFFIVIAIAALYLVNR